MAKTSLLIPIYAIAFGHVFGADAQASAEADCACASSTVKYYRYDYKGVKFENHVVACLENNIKEVEAPLAVSLPTYLLADALNGLASSHNTSMTILNREVTQKEGDWATPLQLQQLAAEATALSNEMQELYAQRILDLTRKIRPVLADVKAKKNAYQPKES